MTKVVSSNIFPPNCHMFMSNIIMNHDGICFSQSCNIYIALAKYIIIMSDVITKICFISIIHLQCNQTVNIF